MSSELAGPISLIQISILLDRTICDINITKVVPAVRWIVVKNWSALFQSWDWMAAMVKLSTLHIYALLITWNIMIYFYKSTSDLEATFDSM